MTWITFEKETINLDTVTHITLDTWERSNGYKNSFICFHFIGGYSEDSITFYQFNVENEENPTYHEVKTWVERFQPHVERKEVE